MKKKKKICHDLWTLFSLCFCAETLCKAAVCSGGGGSRVHYTGSVGPLQARVAGASQGVLLITNLGKLTDKHKKKKKVSETKSGRHIGLTDGVGLSRNPCWLQP